MITHYLCDVCCLQIETKHEYCVFRLICYDPLISISHDVSLAKHDIFQDKFSGLENQCTAIQACVSQYTLPVVLNIFPNKSCWHDKKGVDGKRDLRPRFKVIFHLACCHSITTNGFSFLTGQIIYLSLKNLHIIFGCFFVYPELCNCHFYSLQRKQWSILNVNVENDCIWYDCSHASYLAKTSASE